MICGRAAYISFFSDGFRLFCHETIWPSKYMYKRKNALSFCEKPYHTNKGKEQEGEEIEILQNSALCYHVTFIGQSEYNTCTMYVIQLAFFRCWLLMINVETLRQHTYTSILKKVIVFRKCVLTVIILFIVFCAGVWHRILYKIVYTVK